MPSVYIVATGGICNVIRHRRPLTSSDRNRFRQAVLRHVRYDLGTTIESLSTRERFLAVAYSVRDLMIDGLLATEKRYQKADAKRVYYLSMEFLIGRSLSNNLRQPRPVRRLPAMCCDDLGISLDEVEESEVDAALGNGGLGRLAACFLDSLATLGLPGFGYGINYEYGLFRQEIRNGEQIEKPDNWRTYATPWQIERPQDVGRRAGLRPGRARPRPHGQLITPCGSTGTSSSACRTTSPSSATAARRSTTCACYWPGRRRKWT